jgi:hypothetical protein
MLVRTSSDFVLEQHPASAIVYCGDPGEAMSNRGIIADILGINKEPLLAIRLAIRNGLTANGFGC